MTKVFFPQLTDGHWLKKVPLSTVVTVCQKDRNLEPSVAISPTPLRKSGYRKTLIKGKVEMTWEWGGNRHWRAISVYLKLSLSRPFMHMPLPPMHLNNV